MIVWDTGTYRNLTERDGEEVPVDRAVDDGHVAVWLEGHKLTGPFALTRRDVRGRSHRGGYAGPDHVARGLGAAESARPAERAR